MIHVFLINPNAGSKDFDDALRKKLLKIPDLEYYIFSIRHPGQEKELVDKILHFFRDETIRFYCCGGSGTINKVLNAIEDPSKVEIAFYPCGITNDFLKVFGEDEKYFYDVEKLIFGRVEAIDYIETGYGRALNTFSTGLDVNHVVTLEKNRTIALINENMLYMLALIKAIFFSRSQKYEISMDGEIRSGGFCEVFFGNGHAIGGNIFFADKSLIKDGKANMVVGPDTWGLGLIWELIPFMKKRYDKVSGNVTRTLCSELKIRRWDGAPFVMNFDGEIMGPRTEWTAKIVRRGLLFVVPKEVKKFE